MKSVQHSLFTPLLLLLTPALNHARAQLTPTTTPLASTASTSIPQLVRYAGYVLQTDAKPGSANITFLIFKDEKGGEPLWIETQRVTNDAQGRYEVHLGATSVSGLPSDLFASGEARWLEVQVSGSTPRPRVLLASVPYAMKVAEAATLGGLPASAFLLASTTPAAKAAQAAGIKPDAGTAVTSTGGVAGYLPVYTSASNIDDSLLFQSGTKIGIANGAPATTLDVNGSVDVRGPLTLTNSGTAAKTAGANSHSLDFTASTFNASIQAAQNATFALQAEPVGNDTTPPASSLNLLYGLAATPAETGLKLSAKGLLSFATGQAFTSTATSGNAIAGTSSSGDGVAGTSTTGDGVLGDTSGSTLGTAGVLGVAGGRNTDSFSGIAGVWGDAATHVGVLGTSNQAAGVEGISGTGQGILGQSTSATGVQGTSTSGTGVNGSSSSADGVLGYTAGNTLGTAGTFGVAGPRTSFNGIAAVWGDAASHVGVFGSSTTYSGAYGASTNGNGIEGSSVNGSGASFTSAGTGATVVANNTATSSTGGNALYASATESNAQAVSATSSGAGGVGISAASNGTVAVYGNTPAGGRGVEGISTAGMGVVGIAVNTSVVGIGFANDKVAMWADSGSNPDETDILATLKATADDSRGAVMINNSSEYSTLLVQNNGSAGIGQFPYPNVIRAGGKGGSCTISVHGDLSCTGQVKTLSATPSKRIVETYAVHSPENWVEDFGSGSLQGGVATVIIDPLFTETANTNVDYHILLSPRGDTKNLYVAHLTANGFEVHESNHGTSTVTFDYRIVAKRKGYEAQRLNDVTEARRAENARYEVKHAKQHRQGSAPSKQVPRILR